MAKSVGLRPTFKLILYALWALALTGLTFVMGAPVLKWLRMQMGRQAFWLVLPGVSLLLLSVPLAASGPGGAELIGLVRWLGLSFLSLVVLVGLFEEFLEMGYQMLGSACLTLLIAALLASGGFAFWVSTVGPGWPQMVTSALELSLKPMLQMNSELKVDYADLMARIPSFVIMLWMAALYLAVFFDGRIGSPNELRARTARRQILDYRLPDICIWVFIASLLGAFVDFGSKPLQLVSMNVMNVTLVALFFQGLAVVALFFERLKLSSFWQTVLMVLVVLQLFLFVCALGLSDFWLNFRGRLAKRIESVNREH